MSNVSFFDNYTQGFNRSNITRSYIIHDHNSIITTIIVFDVIFFVFGTVVNLWFLLAILLSRDMRASMRNKVVCNMMLAHLIDALVQCPLDFGRMLSLLFGTYFKIYCYYETVSNIIYHVQDFAANWLLVILVSLFLAQVTDFEPKLRGKWTALCVVLILASPWVVAIITVPPVLKSYSRVFDETCITTTRGSLKVFKSLDTIVPLLVSIVVLLAAVIWRWSRSPSRHYSGNIRAQLLESGPSLDPVKAYVALVVTAVLCDTPLTILYMSPRKLIRLSYKVVIYLHITLMALATSRFIWATLTLLLFPDIRARIRTWRPWARWSTQTDLVISYKKDSV